MNDVTRQGHTAFWRSWNWTQWLVLAVVLGIAVLDVYQRQLARLQMLDARQLQVLEADIQEYKTQAERLAQLERLPPVKSQWHYVTAIARKYGVRIQIVGDGERPGLYEGPLAAWHGELLGNVTAVLVAAREIQAEVPTYLHGFTASRGTATLGFSVLGSE